ncbi:succinate-semialdehyde dehydrogenase [Nocardioides sp. Soil774]|uniref:NAD-dependent succinate-semialdehyde dehydrogenase n=1 Tax=Nocardioides sp. Soil774 TaxID=1736408 RepID=UPI0006F6EA3C|nr:NAD-dependent succinate-semialdehyde dehydrogenase [Nocardioides sp. Soil774]KRE92545.1 succinate-semialdehyde dehydrogenase [Nocardioides sp. Soil774]
MSDYQVVNPSTGEVEKEFPTATDAEVQDALARSHAAYGEWRTTSKDARSTILRRVADLYDERADELAAIIAREMGKPVREGKGELKLVSSIYRYYADQGAALLADTPLDPAMGGSALVRKEAIGPLLGIMPWNFPYYQVARFAAPNLMVGNTILLKHAPQCPESALAIDAIFADAGLPADAYINLFATNEQSADIIADPRVVGVSVTGSERAGSAVAEVAGRHLKKVVLELGGSDPFILLDADDLGAAVKSAVRGRMGNAGQACNGAKRMIVVDELYDAFVEQFTAAMAALTPGDPFDQSSGFGPLSSEAAADNLLEQVEDAVAKGATLRTGGKRLDRPGAFVGATVLTDVTPDMRAYREELFGPAAVVYRVADAAEAVALANDSSFGLGGVVWSSDVEQAQQVADQLDTGMVWINSAQGSAADLPFGGTKRSGVGRELGPYGIDEFVNKKLIYTPAAR